MITWKEAEVRIASGGTITREELRQLISKSGGRTAAQSEQLFRACPEWVAEHEARETEFEALKQRAKEEQALLLADLRRAGYPAKESVYELANTADSYPDAIPVLLNHLKRPYSDRTKEGIVRALTVREARGIAGPAIIEVLRNSQGSHPTYRWSLANALTVVADRADREAISGLIEVEADDDVRTWLKRALKTAAKP